MKRMSEVFKMPVVANMIQAIPCEAMLDGVWITTASTHAAHAINHVDALADNLEEALLQIEYLNKKLGETGSGNSVLSRGNSALNAYRGAK